MKNSLKQLLRTPGKTLLFFFLMALAAFLLVFSASTVLKTTQQIDALETQFSTLGTMEQPLVSTTATKTKPGCYGGVSFSRTSYAAPIPLESLDFPGAGYVEKPENRPYYVANIPELTRSDEYRSVFSLYQIAEFTALEDSDEYGKSKVRIEKALYGTDTYHEKLEEGMELSLCQCLSEKVTPMKAGKRYVASLVLNSSCSLHGKIEYMVATAPYTTQHRTDGTEVESAFFGESGLDSLHREVEEVTAGFWESGRGMAWLEMAEFRASFLNLFYVAPTNSLQMLPVFQKKQAYVQEGREIKKEEYESGALVCMVSQDLLAKNFLQIGDKIPLPLTYSLYGVDHARSFTGGGFYDFGPFNAEGKAYQPFWEAEYEIVGTFQMTDKSSTYSAGELPQDLFIIPAKSVGASDENNIANFGPMNGRQATFQIKNGTISEFDAALRAAVPDAVQLEITYNDNGYTDIAQNLHAIRLTAVLLLAASSLASLAITFLLLFFFIVKQKKRTAIERSLGKTKRQCRVSILAGLLVLTVAAAAVGGVGGTVAVNQSNLIASQETANDTEYDPAYSLWATHSAETVELETTGTDWVCFAAPALLCALVFVLSLILVNRNLKIEPIYLLSVKVE